MNVVAFLSQLNDETKILLCLSIILFSGFIMTRMTNTLNMPKVSGYILAGILIGPCCFNFIPKSMIDGMSFVSDLALSFIAFGVGKFFKKEVLMRTGKRIIIITLSEALAAGVLVTFCLKFIFNLDWEFALILGAIATATAPASTMMTINQYKAKGEFVDTLLQIVALDDVVCLLAFSIVTAMVNGNAAGGFSAHDLLIPVAYNLLVIVLGIFCGYFLSRLLIPARSKDNRLILAIAMLLGLSGICAAIDISPLLSCMVFGAVYINLTRDKKLFRQINSFTPPVMSVFFIVSGMNLDLNALKTVGAIGVSYFVIRIVGKYMGTYLSCLFTKTSRQIRNYMGFALIPQAGVAIGLAFLGQRMLPPETGNLMLTIILSSSVLYEMVGPVSAKAALVLSGSIPFGKRPEELTEETEGLPGSSEGLMEADNWEKPESALISEKEEYPAYPEKKDSETKRISEEKKSFADKEDLTEKREAGERKETEEQEDEDAQWEIAAQKEREAAVKSGAGTEQKAAWETEHVAEVSVAPATADGREAAGVLAATEVPADPDRTKADKKSETEASSAAEVSATKGSAAASAVAGVTEVLPPETKDTATFEGKKEAFGTRGGEETETGEETGTEEERESGEETETEEERKIGKETESEEEREIRKETEIEEETETGRETETGEETEIGEKEAEKSEGKAEDKNREKPEDPSASGKNKERRKKKTGKNSGKEDKADKREKSAGKKRRQEGPDTDKNGTLQGKETEKEESPERDEEIKAQKQQEVREESEDQEIFRQFMDSELTEEPEDPEEEEDHAVLPELREYSRGVEERDVYDIEREVKPQKSKKKKKGKKADGKVRKE